MTGDEYESTLTDCVIYTRDTDRWIAISKKTGMEGFIHKVMPDGLQATK